MKRKALSGLLAVCLGIIGTCFVTITLHQRTAQSVKAITLTQMQKKHENRLIAQTYARIGYGWTGREWKCLESLWTAESRFDSAADNPRSSARGIAQHLGETSSDARIQVLRGNYYIFKRYGAPCRAWKWHQRHGWY